MTNKLLYRGLVLLLAGLGIGCGNKGAGPTTEDDQNDTLLDTFPVPLYGVLPPKIIVDQPNPPDLSELSLSFVESQIVDKTN